ncbi:preprotein translocase subunit SecE [Corynebacterium sp. UMB9976]|uniref:preprotein translocase subunit SecE n=1 Tax=Corynebacterium sp. UMB9976 TaxID=3046354 RepID=UPI00254E04F2|nr:preprotein translocase subunit SecE [Corynebacterium sp. UMB9976]MDK6301817.1 preprotein translocase subunit SecE [Corynebacterium sp. UMB9976]
MSEDSNRAGGSGANASGGSMRPSGKRQVAGQATTARATSASTTPEVVETRSNPFTAIADYIRGVISEMRKVIWPTGREMVTYSIVVLVFLVLMTALVAGVDYVTGLGVRWVFGV